MTDALTETLDDEIVELGEITGSLGFLLRMAQLRAFDYFFQTLGEHDLRPGEFTVLWVIGLNPGLRQGTIARRLHIKPAHMTKLIQRLSAAGWVTRTVPQDDRRSVRLALTGEGEAFVARYRDGFLHAHLAERSNLAPDDAEHLIALLRRYSGLEGAGT
ncbi:MarR family winged helix-turn-helix transcriptional regulator [Sinisalibacter aestuarii]|uniref:MarR family transcriptional regulator n=1 Tax=Sinisalibacter aestuarii TaxID=2949426 RepID=A0ABQ5LPD5_9RHOB|nr:MarR family transcriptional regulator [Sinisalibacter aestuarii]GKY86865.1 MarR family transcriptional regulator [Sinisalibacter aestuarii]